MLERVVQGAEASGSLQTATQNKLRSWDQATIFEHMSRSYKFHDPEGTYFITFATVEWVDAFTRRAYKDILVESLQHCQERKGLLLYAWVIMSNHVHLIAAAADGHVLPDIRPHLLACRNAGTRSPFGECVHS